MMRAHPGNPRYMSPDDPLYRRILEGNDRTIRVSRFRRTATDARSLLSALASLPSPTSVRNAVIALDERSAKRALIAAALDRHSRDVSAEEHAEWMRADDQLDLTYFDVD